MDNKERLSLLENNKRMIFSEEYFYALVIIDELGGNKLYNTFQPDEKKNQCYLPSIGKSRPVDGVRSRGFVSGYSAIYTIGFTIAQNMLTPKEDTRW